MIKFSVVILNYNTAKETIDCISSIYDIWNENIKINIIIVDNCSSDDSVSVLKHKYQKNEDIIILEQHSNKGFSKGNNVGYQYALENYQPDYIIVSNSDILFRKHDFWKQVNRLYQKYHYAVLGPDIYVPSEFTHQNPMLHEEYSKQNVEQILKKLNEKLSELEKCQSVGIYDFKGYSLNRIRFRNILRNMYSVLFRRKYMLELIDKYLHGSFLIFSKTFFERFPKKCFEPEVFYYGEEDILFYKCRREGLKLVYSPKIKVIHLRGKSAGKVVGERTELTREIFNIRNEINSKQTLLDFMNGEIGLGK